VSRGIRAVVLDGTTRDINENREMRFPVFCLGVVPAGSQKNWGGNINIPIHCAGVAVNPGDIVVGDSDGVVVVPADRAVEILDAAKSKARAEERWITEIEGGKSTLEIIGLDKKLKKYYLQKSETYPELRKAQEKVIRRQEEEE